MGWSGPATLKLVGDKDQTEAIAIEAVSRSELHRCLRQVDEGDFILVTTFEYWMLDRGCW